MTDDEPSSTSSVTSRLFTVSVMSWDAKKPHPWLRNGPYAKACSVCTQGETHKLHREPWQERN